MRSKKTRLFNQYSFGRHGILQKKNYFYLNINFYILHIVIDTTTSRKKTVTASVLSDSNIASGASATNAKDNNNGNSAAIECQPTGIYTLSDPEECNAYYQCDKGTRTKLNCPEGKLFDTEKRECNDFERVSCGTRVANPSEKNQCKFMKYSNQ